MLKSSGREKNISVFEAHAMWSLLSAKYHIQDNVYFWLNHAHDEDLKRTLETFMKDLEEHIKLLEGEMKKYSIFNEDVNNFFDRFASHAIETDAVR